MSKPRIIILGVISFAMLGAGVGYYWVTSDNQGAIYTKEPEVLRQEMVSDQVLEGLTMRLMHKGSYTPYSLPVADNDIEIYKLSATTGYTNDFVISVSKLANGQLDSNSAYILRTTRTDMYEQQQATYPVGEVTLFKKLDQDEVAAFIKQSDKVAILSFTQAGTAAGDLMTEVDAVLKSFAWKE